MQKLSNTNRRSCSAHQRLTATTLSLENHPHSPMHVFVMSLLFSRKDSKDVPSNAFTGSPRLSEPRCGFTTKASVVDPFGGCRRPIRYRVKKHGLAWSKGLLHGDTQLRVCESVKQRHSVTQAAGSSQIEEPSQGPRWLLLSGHDTSA